MNPWGSIYGESCVTKPGVCVVVLAVKMLFSLDMGMQAPPSRTVNQEFFSVSLHVHSCEWACIQHPVLHRHIPCP
jgi:hypothetical protein